MALPRCQAAAVLAILLGAGWVSAADDLFDEAEVHDVRLCTSPADWQKLKDNFRDDTYYPCDLMWRGRLARNAGLRSRGNGSRDAVKPALRVDFNRYVAGQEFAGLTSLVLNNLRQDPPMIRLTLALLVFRRMGHPTPRASYARLYVNDSYAGLYLLEEPIDKRFLKRVFGDDNGYLYDYNWAFEYRMEYLGPSSSLYVPVPFGPKTHEEDPDPGSLVELIRTVNQAPDTDFVAATGMRLDWQRFINYLAVENFIGQRDGFTGDYGINNFYLHRSRDRARFQLIPWDQDAAFFTPEHPIFHRLESNVLTRRALADPALRWAYLDALLKCAEVAELPGKGLVDEIRWRYDLIRSAALEDTFKAYSNDQFELEVAGLLWTGEGRGRFVREAATAALAAAH
jgi:spore coat protein CotH